MSRNYTKQAGWIMVGRKRLRSWGVCMSTALLLISGLPVPRVGAAATITTIAGSGGDSTTITNEVPAVSVQLWNPTDVVATSDGTVYFSDTSHQEIRSVTSDGVIHAAFGDGVSGCGTGPTQTRVWNPRSMVTDTANNIYVATGCGEIVRFTPGNSVGTVVAGKFDGTGNPNRITQDGMNALSVTMLPDGLSYDRTTGAIYFIDGATYRVVRLNSNGTISLVGGNGTAGYSGDGGPALSAQFNALGGTYYDGGNLYVSDYSGCRIRMIDSAGVINTVVGNGTCSNVNDNGPGTSASIEPVSDFAMDANGLLYFADSLSGAIFTYDPDTKMVAPAISIPSACIKGLSFDGSGDLLAVSGCGAVQQVFRVSGLVSTTPPPDGLQHGRITNVQWNNSPTTPLWKMDVTVDVSNVSCPAVAVVDVGDWQKRAIVCGSGETAPKTVNFAWKMFNGTHSFQPGSDQNVTAFIEQSDAPGYGTSVTALHVPGKPAIIGVGDSYLSGHHQNTDLPWCAIDANQSCEFVANDYNYSWVTKMAAKLNEKAPTEWKFDYDQSYLLARSGATTRQMFDDGQIARMQTLIGNHAGSWNIVAMDGGANNVDFQSALSDFYYAHNFPTAVLAPWDAKYASDCPNSQQLYLNLVDQSSTIENDLSAIVSTARNTSSTTRFIDMLYPYVTNTTDPSNYCVYGGAGFAGSKTVLDNLDALHAVISGPDILTLDLRTEFGGNPMKKIQQIRNYGYPHPNATGQDKIAKSATILLKQ